MAYFLECRVIAWFFTIGEVVGSYLYCCMLKFLGIVIFTIYSILLKLGYDD